MTDLERLAAEIKSSTPADQLRLAAELFETAKASGDQVQAIGQLRIARQLIQRVDADLAALVFYLDMRQRKPEQKRSGV